MTLNPNQMRQTLQIIRNCVCDLDCATLNCDFFLAIMMTENPNLNLTARNRNLDAQNRFRSFDAGLMQINTATALRMGCVGLTQNDGESLEDFHTRIASELEDLERNLRCACQYLHSIVREFGCPSADLLAAGYNAGGPAVRLARIQEMLNDLKEVFQSNRILQPDGGWGTNTEAVLGQFCEWYNRTYPDRRIDCNDAEEVKRRVREEWRRQHTGQPDPTGKVPDNRDHRTPDYVGKFKRNLSWLQNRARIPCCPTEEHPVPDMTDNQLRNLEEWLRQAAQNDGRGPVSRSEPDIPR